MVNFRIISAYSFAFFAIIHRICHLPKTKSPNFHWGFL